MAEFALLAPNGMLGRAFGEALRQHGVSFAPLAHGEVDLTRPATFDRIAATGARFVINAAAYTNVDGAETHEADAMAVNAEGVGALGRYARDHGLVVVHFGSDYVFDGRGTAPYAVDAPLAPRGVYARSKARGEELLRASGAEHLYVRTSWLYAPWGKNFVRTIARNARVRDVLRVVDDQRGRPTSCEHLAALTLSLLDRGARGTFHGTDGDECTWFELARAVVDGLAPSTSCRVEPCKSSDWPSPVERPAYSVLDLATTEALLGPMPSWRTNLASVLARLEPL